MHKDLQPRGNVHEFTSSLPPNDPVPRKDKSVRRRWVVTGIAVPTLAAILTACGVGASSSLPDITRVTSTSQLPPASSQTESDYSHAELAVGDAELASVGDYAQVNQDLGAIKNSKIADFATSAVDTAEAWAALNAADDQQFTDSSPEEVTQSIQGLRVKGIRIVARRALDLVFGGAAIIAAGDMSNLSNKPSADDDLSHITSLDIRRQAQKGVKVALVINSGAYDIASMELKQATRIENILYVAGEKQAKVLAQKAQDAYNS